MARMMISEGESLSVHTCSDSDTMEFAQKLAAILDPGDWIGLTGDLGAGKTCFCRGLARGLGVGDEIPVTSPTFTILQTYTGRMLMSHLDLYRLGDYSELLEIGYDEILAEDGVCAVEWCDKFTEAIGEDGIIIDFQLLDENNRTLSIKALGPRGENLLNSIRKF